MRLCAGSKGVDSKDDRFYDARNPLVLRGKLRGFSTRWCFSWRSRGILVIIITLLFQDKQGRLCLPESSRSHLTPLMCPLVLRGKLRGFSMRWCFSWRSRGILVIIITLLFQDKQGRLCLPESSRSHLTPPMCPLVLREKLRVFSTRWCFSWLSRGILAIPITLLHFKDKRGRLCLPESSRPGLTPLRCRWLQKP
jgi:hypothetical protein